ncbi:hypothetical protein DMB92_09160, partial [Campylobacter sp. MIT 99-7217]
MVKKEDLKESFEKGGTQGRSEKQDKKIKSISLAFKPELIFERGGSFAGIPIIAKDGQVISGNHRIAGMKGFNEASLKAYQQAVKDKFNLDLKDDELLIRLYESDDLQSIKNLALRSNAGLERNIGEKALSNLAKFEEELKELPSFINSKSVDEQKAIIARALDKESNGLDDKNANLALLSYISRTSSNNDISRALNELKNVDLQTKNKILNMFIDNAGGFYNLAKDSELKALNLQSLINDSLVSA